MPDEPHTRSIARDPTRRRRHRARAPRSARYGVTGFAGGWIGRGPGTARPRPPGIDVTFGEPLGRRRQAGPRDRPRAHRRLRPADRGGRPPGRFGGPLRDPQRARPRGRPADDPRRRAPLPARRPARDAAAGPRRGHARRPRRERHGRRLIGPAPDGPQGLRRRRPARRVPRGRRQPRGARRRDQRAERLPGPRRRHRLEHARDRPGRARRGRGASARCTAERIAGGDQLRRADGRPRQLRRDHEPDPPRHGRGPRRQDAASTASTSRTRCQQGTKTAYGAVAQAGRGHDPHGHPRGVGGGGRGGRAANDDRDRPRRRRSRRPSESVAKTPSLLPILREAGVVDSGGQGLFRLFEGALLSISGPSGPRSTGAAAPRAPRTPRRQRSGAPAGAGARRGLRLRDDVPRPGRSPGRRSTSTRSATTSSRSASRVLVAGDARALKVHVHNERPDEVIAYGLGLGTLSRISVENLDTRPATSARRGRPSSPASARRPAQAGAEPRPDTATARRADAPADRRRRPGDRRVVAGEGLATVFRDFGVAPDPSTAARRANPSTGELLRVARLARAREVLLLPEQPERPPRRASRRRRSATTAASSSSRRATPPRASPPCSPSTRTLDAAANAEPDDRGGPRRSRRSR